jgi:hypothetical protein
MALYMRPDYDGAETGIDLQQSFRLQALGYELAQEEFNAVYKLFLEVADRRKEGVEAGVRAYVNAMNKVIEGRATRGEKVPMLNVP